MSALVKKEIRLLLPAWVTAMLVVFAPIPIGLMIEGNCRSGITAVRMSFAVAMASVILGLAGFGREVSSRTFSLLLAQPRSRRELWRAKIGVLLGALLPLGLFLLLVHQVFVPRPPIPSEARGVIALVWFLTVCAAVTGGLWTTLLFRQIIAAFWISVVVPFAIFALAMQPEDEHLRSILATVLLLAYSVAGYRFARWQFLRAQDSAWTGGNVSLPGIANWLPWTGAAARRKSPPLFALVGKEFQFQQINFLLGGVLLLMQIAVLVAQRFARSEERTALQMMLENFWGIWIVMPLLVGSGAVAEERKLGMLETHLCLPISRTWQFAVKFVVTLICGTLLGAAVPVALALSHQIGPGQIDQGFLLGWPLCCTGLALVAFYASTLTNQLLQAFGAAIGILIAAMLAGNWFAGYFSGADGQVTCFGYLLWRGPLVLFTGASVMLLAAMLLSWRRLRWVWIGFVGLIGVSLVWLNTQTWPAALACLQSEVLGVKTIVVASLALAASPVILTLVLAARNTDRIQTSLSLWWRNAGVWLGCLLLTGILNTLTYHRAWELFWSFEPSAGATRLRGPTPPAIAGIHPNNPAFVLLPDGRVCAFRGYQQTALPARPSGAPAENSEIWQVIASPRVEFLAGSNWVAMAASLREFVGVQADGSMWRAVFFEQVDAAGHASPLATGVSGTKGLPRRTKRLALERFGEGDGWKSVAASWNHCVALQRDGSVWGWGSNQNGQLGEGSELATNELVRVSPASDWVAVFAAPGHTFAVNQAGEIWKWGQFATDLWGKNIEKGPVKLNLKVPGVRAIASNNNVDLILDAEGKLWGFGRIQTGLVAEAPGHQLYAKAIQQPGENWSAMSLTWEGLVLLKNDGILWSRTWEHHGFRPEATLAQVGRRNDWVAVTREFSAVLALARDGTICRFGEAWPSELELLAPTRRVTWSLDLLDAAR